MNIIDIHTHGIKGYDSRTTDLNHILKIAEIHGCHGVTNIVLTIYPGTIKVMRENMMIVKKAMEIQNIESEKKSARIIGVHLEGPFLNPLKCGALNAMTFLEPSEYSFRELIEGFEDIVKIITIAPELNGAINLIKIITDYGIIASMGHSDATYNEAERGYNAGAKGITHIFNAMRGIHHREPGIAGFGLLNKDIYIEVIADPFHLHPEILNLIFRLKDHERIILISDTVKETMDNLFIISPENRYEKNIFPQSSGVTNAHGKLLGGSITIVESSKRLISEGYKEDIIMKTISENPERYLSR